jgi:hypothetical protein
VHSGRPPAAESKPAAGSAKRFTSCHDLATLCGGDAVRGPASHTGEGFVPLSRRWSTMFMPARMRRLARTLMILVAVLGVGVVSTGIAQAELSIGNGEYIIINSLHVGYPALSTTSKCGKSLIDGPGGLPVTVVATFVNADGSGPNAPYGGLESWSGGTVGTDDDHYGTDVGGNQTQFFHVMAYPADGWHGAGAYRFDPFAQDGSLKVAYTATERTVNVAGYPPSGGGEFVKCPFAHPFDINNVLSDAAKSGAEEVLGAACEACSAWYDGVKQALDFNDLFNSSLKNSIVDDPPDNNYQQLVTAQPAPVLDPPAGMTADQDSTLLNLESALATDIGLDRALLTSEDRAWGALNGGDRSAYLAQTKAIAAFADQLAGNIPALDQLFTDFQAAYAPSIPAFSVTHQDVARYQVDSMKGVMPDEAAVLSQLGATTADEAQIVDAIISVDATQISAADGVNALFQQNDDALVGPLQGMATWARDVATTPPPVVLDVSPGTLDPSGGQQVTVTGSNLTGVTALTFGASTPTSGQGIDVACTSDTECTAYAPPGHGTVDVVAVGPGGPSATGPQDRVSYVAPAKPVVTRIYPSSGPISGRTEVSVTGSGLSGGTVYFGPTPSDSVRCSDTLCTAYSPTAASAGAVDIQVQTDGGATRRAGHRQHHAVERVQPRRRDGDHQRLPLQRRHRCTVRARHQLVELRRRQRQHHDRGRAAVVRRLDRRRAGRRTGRHLGGDARRPLHLRRRRAHRHRHLAVDRPQHRRDSLHHHGHQSGLRLDQCSDRRQLRLRRSLLRHPLHRHHSARHRRRRGRHRVDGQRPGDIARRVHLLRRPGAGHRQRHARHRQHRRRYLGGHLRQPPRRRAGDVRRLSRLRSDLHRHHMRRHRSGR